MNFVIVTLNMASVALLIKPEQKHNILIVHSYQEVIDLLCKLGDTIKDYILLTEFKIPKTNGQEINPYNVIELVKKAAHHGLKKIIVGLTPQQCKNPKMEFLQNLIKKNQVLGIVPNKIYLLMITNQPLLFTL